MSKYEKLLYYRTFIHSYYDEKINNPFWGKYFKNPLISRLLTKIINYENEAIDEYPLLKMILAYRNKEKYPLSRNGINSLEYLAKISGETYSSANKLGTTTTPEGPIVPLMVALTVFVALLITEVVLSS
jgi:asparagine synthase (glutamine-hydrolysing)